MSEIDWRDALLRVLVYVDGCCGCSTHRALTEAEDAALPDLDNIHRGDVEFGIVPALESGSRIDVETIDAVLAAHPPLAVEVARVRCPIVWYFPVRKVPSFRDLMEADTVQTSLMTTVDVQCAVESGHDGDHRFLRPDTRELVSAPRYREVTIVEDA